MIRDQFKETKKVSAKEARKKKEMGERNYYITQVPKLKDLSKSIDQSLKITTILLLVCYALVFLSFILSLVNKTEYNTTAFIWWSVGVGGTIIFNLVWKFIIKVKINKKIDYYKGELERINNENLRKFKHI